MSNDPLMKSSPLTIREALQRVLTAAEALPVPAEGFYATWHGVLDDARAALAAHDYARQLRQTYPCSYVAVRQAGQSSLPIDEY